MIIDLNADLGEWSNNETTASRVAAQSDSAMLGLVTSANVACGFHASDATVMEHTCAAALAHGVVIGAHVSYDDREGFGRRALQVTSVQLRADIRSQIVALESAATRVGATVRYVKAHGALYNQCAHDVDHATAIVQALVDHDRSLGLLVSPGSVLEHIADEHHVPTVSEAFVDRAYHVDGTLVPREMDGAVLVDPAACAAQALALATSASATSIDGLPVDIRARSLCLHGDTPGAVRIAQMVRRALHEVGVSIGAPW